MYGGADPDIAIIAQDHTGSTGQVVEVSLLAFDEGWTNFNEAAL